MQLTLSTNSMTFGPTIVGQSSSSQMVNVYNPSSAAINAVTPVISGDFMVSASTCTVPLAAGSSCNVWVRSAPKSISTTLSGTLTVNADGVAAGTVILSGTGIGGPITINKTTMTFAPLAVGLGSSSQMVTLYNNSGLAITVTPSLGGSDFMISGNSCTGSIAAGGQCNIWVRFTPKAATASGGSLTISANSGVVGIVSLSGTGL